MKRISIFVLLTLLVVISLHGCRWFRMDVTDNKLKIVNDTDYHVSVLVNFQYPDTSLDKASPNQYIPSNDTGSVVVINEKWKDVIQRTRAITLFFVPRDSLKKHSPNWQGKIAAEKELILTESKLDSIGWIVNFP